MSWRELAAMAAANLARRPGRTILTTVGVIVGAAALVLMVSLGVGLQRATQELFSSDGSLRSIYVTRISPTANKKVRARPLMFGGAGRPGGIIATADIEALRKLPGIASVTPDLSLMLDAEFSGLEDGTATDAFLGGVVPEDEPEFAAAISTGALWTSRDERVCVVTSRFVEARFKDIGAGLVGRTVTFSNPFLGSEDAKPTAEELTFRVAGIVRTERVGIRAAIYLPFGRGEELREKVRGGKPHWFALARRGAYLSCWVKAAAADDVKPLQDRLKNSGYEAMSQADFLEALATFFTFVEGFLACIGAIGLVVSLFGIANTMAMAVIERTREIGILKSLGARARDVRRIFLLEAAGIGAAGGVAGLAAGVAAGALLNAAAHGFWTLPPGVKLFHVSAPLAAGAVGFAILVSAIAGFFPARRAARLDPVGALRYE